MRPLLALLGLLLGAPSTEQVCVPMPINTWVALPTEGAPPQNARRIRWLDGRLWYLGETVTAFDPCTNSWRSLPNTGRPKKPTEWFDSISKIVGVAGKLVVIKEDVGGVTERDGFSVAIIDERGWRVLAVTIPMEPVVAATDREVLIWGGSRDRRIDEARSVVDTVGTGVRIDPIRATVTPITTKTHRLRAPARTECGPARSSLSGAASRSRTTGAAAARAVDARLSAMARSTIHRPTIGPRLRAMVRRRDALGHTSRCSAHASSCSAASAILLWRVAA